MKDRLIRLLLCVFVLHQNVASLAQGKVRKALFILVDGIPADVVESVPTPHLDSLAGRGRYLRAYVGGGKGTYSESPTISAVGYNSLLTGTWANKHNVWDNAIEAPNYHYPTIFQLFKTQYPQKKIAIFSSWLDNRTKLAGEGLEQTGRLRFDYHADGHELDTVHFPHDKGRNFMHRIDNQVVEAAAAHIDSQAPDLSWVYLEYTDDMGHMYGDGERYYEAVKKMDAQLGRIFRAVQGWQQRYQEEWLIFVTTDHGRDEQTGKSHGGQSLRQRSTWLATNHPQLNDYARYYTPAIVDIMPSIARFMHIQVPEDISRELDGLPLIGDVSLAGVEVNQFQNKLDITWKALASAGKVKIWVSTTNQFKSGGKDNYQLMAEVPLAREHATIDASKLNASFYKVVVEGSANSMTKWVVQEAQQK